MEVPVISLPVDTCIAGDATAQEQEVAKAVRCACESTGFFYLAGSGIPDSLFDDVFRVNRQLFSLPLEEKQKLLADENNRGWTPFKEQTLDPANQTTGDTKEGFYLGRDIPKDDPEAEKPLHGPNQWPDERLVPGYRATMEAYMAACIALGKRVVKFLALSLELPANYFDASFSNPMVNMRPLHYHAVVSQPSDGVFGAGAHTDWGMLTFLKTDDVPGLQIFSDGRWTDVPPKPGCFIVNLGDMLERWTNGLYRSTLHRVVNTTGQERFSIACFFEPNFDAVVTCLPQCCSPERPAAYPPTTAGQHILDKYKTTHAGYTVQTLEQRPDQ